jgi:hypothetical protein
MALPGLIAANNLSDVVDKERAWDNLGSNLTTGDIAIPTPSLDLNFAANGNLIDQISGQQLIEFSRNSVGTYTNEQGLVASAAIDEHRFDYDPSALTRKGLLLEPASTNLFSNHVIPSYGFGGLSGKFNSSIDTTIQTPRGDFSGVRVLTRNANTTVGPEYVGVTSINLTANVSYTFSIFYKILSGTPIFPPQDPVFVAVETSDPFEEYRGASLAAASFVSYPNEWRRAFTTITPLTTRTYTTVGLIYNSMQLFPAEASIAYWGMQLEPLPVMTSYIATSGSTVTRAADIATISGSNLSSFYNASAGTIYTEQLKQASVSGTVIGDSASNRLLDWQSSRVYRTSWEGVNYIWTGAPAVSATSLNRAALSYGQTARGAVNGTSYTLSPFTATASFATTSLALQGVFSRIVFWRAQLSAEALAAVTAISNTQISYLPPSYSVNTIITGGDILALNGVRNASTRDFTLIKGLTAPAQPRITATAQQIALAGALRNAAMLKASPTTSGNYVFSSGVTLSGVSTRINNTTALSIATSPFSGSTATASILLRELQPQANWRITEPMPSGTITSPEFAIPFETSNFVLFMKTGQS